jgi:hypothetical protein
MNTLDRLPPEYQAYLEKVLDSVDGKHGFKRADFDTYYDVDRYPNLTLKLKGNPHCYFKFKLKTQDVFTEYSPSRVSEEPHKRQFVMPPQNRLYPVMLQVKDWLKTLDEKRKRNELTDPDSPRSEPAVHPHLAEPAYENSQSPLFFGAISFTGIVLFLFLLSPSNELLTSIIGGLVVSAITYGLNENKTK